MMINDKHKTENIRAERRNVRTVVSMRGRTAACHVIDIDQSRWRGREREKKKQTGGKVRTFAIDRRARVCILTVASVFLSFMFLAPHATMSAPRLKNETENLFASSTEIQRPLIHSFVFFLSFTNCVLKFSMPFYSNNYYSPCQLLRFFFFFFNSRNF